MKIFYAPAALAALIALSALTGCGKDSKTEKEDMPPNIISYEEKDGEEFIPVDGVEVHGDAVEDSPEEAETPDEEELGEYSEIFLEGDVIDENTCGGWVTAVSLKDVTVNTYNTLTKYLLSEGAASTAARLKPGDAVLVVHHEDEEGNQVADELGRVRVEDEPLSKDEIMEAYAKAQEAEGETEKTE